MVRVDLLCLGTGKASTHIYHGEPSTGFVLLQDGEPVLLLGAGLGIVRSCIHYCKQIPDIIYVSHNHTDHAGELPLLLSVEAGKGRRKRVAAEPEVMSRLLNHRLAEYHESINLSNRKLSDLAEFLDCPEGEQTHITPQITIIPHKAQHSERCYGFVLCYLDQPILGWSADSGYDVQFYAKLAAAPVVVLDARQTGSYDHAGFENIIEYERQLAAACDAGGEQRVALYATSYGTQAEMPTAPQALRIGQTLVLLDDMGPPVPVAPAHAVPYQELDYGGAVTPRGGIPQGGIPQGVAHASPRLEGGYGGVGYGAQPAPAMHGHPGGAMQGLVGQNDHEMMLQQQQIPQQNQTRSPTASPRLGRRGSGGAGRGPPSVQERSADIKSYLHTVCDFLAHNLQPFISLSPSQMNDHMPEFDEDGDPDKSYHFPLPGQVCFSLSLNPF